MDLKEGYFNYGSKVIDNKLQLIRKKTSGEYEYETQTFFFLSEGEEFYFFIGRNPTLFYVVSKNNTNLAKELVLSKNKNKIKGEIIDDFLNSKFYDDDDNDNNIQETIHKHLDKSYKSFTMFRSFADRQFGNTVCFESVYGIYETNDNIYTEKMIDELFYLCKDSKHNRWIKRDSRIQKILKKTNINETE